MWPKDINFYQGSVQICPEQRNIKEIIILPKTISTQIMLHRDMLSNISI